MYFYENNIVNNEINIYSSKLNRLCYITNNTDNECIFKLKLKKFNKNKLVINLEVNKNGYIIIQLQDKYNKIIPNYDFDSFDKIFENDSLEYIVSWNNKSTLPSPLEYNELIVSFKIYNAKLYTIN